MEKMNLKNELSDYLDELGLKGHCWVIGGDESLQQVLSTRFPAGALHLGVPEDSEALAQCSVLILNASKNKSIEEIFTQLADSDARPVVILLENSSLPGSVQDKLHALGYKLPPVQPKGYSFYVTESADLSHKKYFDVAGYWENRYSAGRNSGAGSYGRLARFKAHFLNNFVRQNEIKSVLEIGCGDGGQLSLADYPQYTGLDISPTAIEHCRRIFAHDSSKRFEVYDPENFNPETVKAELVLSLDVIYHLSNDEVYKYYLDHLFEASARFVVIYSNSSSEEGSRLGINESANYVRFRDVLEDVERWQPAWNLVNAVPNSYPFSAINPSNTSFADFFVFEKLSEDKSESHSPVDRERFASDKIINTLMVFDENYKSLTDDVASANKKIDKLTKAVREVDKTQHLQESLDQANQKVFLLQDELRIAREECHELNLQCREVRQQESILEERLAVADNELSEANEQCSKCQEKNQALEAKLSGLNADFQGISTQHHEISARYRAANAKYRNVSQELSALKSSKAYKSGLYIKEASKSWKGAVKLPVRLWRLRKSKRDTSGLRIQLREGLRYVKWRAVVPLATRMGIPRHRVAYITLPKAIERHLGRAKPASTAPNRDTVAKTLKTNSTEISFTPPSAAAQEISILGWPAPPDNDKPLVLAVMDEFTEGCFGSDVRLLQPRPDNWYGLAKKYPPALVFIESAWKGNGGSWQYRVGSYSNKPGQELEQMASWARQEKVPTVFWNKEDPVHHDKFMEAAGLADHIFTTDQNMVDSYKKRTGNQSVHALPFAAQPALHKPAPLRGRLQKSCFAGSWYGNRHAERGESMKWLLATANKHGLEIFDRNHGTGIFPFPEEYQDGIRGSLPYLELCKEYARYRVFLNVNSVTDSPTMFSRRVFELMACGTPVVSTYAKGIENLFESEAVWLVNSQEEADEAIHTLMTDDAEWRRRSLAGIREVFSGHTYAHRLNNIFEIIGLDERIETTPKLMLLARAEQHAEVEQLASFAEGQDYRNFHLLIKSTHNLNKNELNLPDHVQLVTADELEKYVEQGEKEGFRGIGWISSNHAYGSNYLQDLANAMIYQPEANGWAKACDEDAFAYDVETRLTAAIWRPEVFHKEWLKSEDCTLSSSSLFCTDTDEFQADH
ncbi:glycosyltransferase [Chromohalobacter sarecensis]|uniref:Glycosyltransferase n=1 Tax=Chromohalobacter sarecensis TaxID=245294 RepID=A0ABV9D443_9GAMM|nr:glycosyltransferase [Chromohalobacter sarecensis]MCK0714440.1 glycosyltransferase [Chromohalobacter sarecensis]